MWGSGLANNSSLLMTGNALVGRYSAGDKGPTHTGNWCGRGRERGGVAMDPSPTDTLCVLQLGADPCSNSKWLLRREDCPPPHSTKVTKLKTTSA